VLAGCLDIRSIKAARFVRFCDFFNIPVVTFVDVPGFSPVHGIQVRRHHQTRRETSLRYAECTVQITVITRIRRRVRAMASRTPARRCQLAWPNYENRAVMGYEEGAVEIIFHWRGY
jgi:propionyl-CoA carboxylase beta chain